MAEGVLYVVSAPSGTGKTSLVLALIRSTLGLTFSVSYTTRPKRAGEQDGIDYYFVSVEQFRAMIQQNEFLEYAEVFGHYYGTSKSATEAALKRGLDLILEIDWQGAQQIRQTRLNIVSIFIIPPSREALRERIIGRKKDTLAVIEQRLKMASEEVSHYHEYDYLVVNDQFNVALAQMQSIIQAERCRMREQTRCLADLLEELKG